MNEIENMKIDILRDALKDVSDTLRALDKKTQFLISYNAIFLGLIGAIFLKNSENLEIVIWQKTLFLVSMGILSFFWVMFLKQLMTNFSPEQNPLDAFCSNLDKNFANDTFFVLTGKHCKNLEQLVKNYDDEIHNELSVKKLLYKEIVKLSYIRDKRINVLKDAVDKSSKFTIVLIGFIALFVILGVLFNG